MRFSSLFSAVAVSACVLCTADANWSWTFPPGYVNPQSGHRNNVFYVGQPVTFTTATAIASYQVLDYYGNLVDQGAGAGPAPQKLNLNVANPGWYKLYLYGSTNQGSPWGYAIGGTMFVIFRNTPNFPALPGMATSGGWDSSEDEVMRGVTAMGPQRLKVSDATNPTQAITQLAQDIAIDQQMYLPYDPARKRQLLVAFPNGTQDSNGVEYPGVARIVQHFQNVVQYWECRNEPNGNSTASYFAWCELPQFYAAVKGVNPNLKVVAPAVGSINASLINWVDTFLTDAAGQFDVFSFHAYNCVNGDPWLVRQTMNGYENLLAKHQMSGLETWQTEQGYMAAVYGSYQPRLQGRWTMLQMMLYEQYAIPKEHNYIWYDVSNGYWTEPMFWENDDGSLNPAAALMRVWSEELYGTNYVNAYNFGTVANDMYIGDYFAGTTKAVAAFMTAGNPYGVIQLSLPGLKSVTVTSPFGQSNVYTVTNGLLALPVSELPSYVELQPGQSCSVIAPTYGQNLALQPGVTITASGGATTASTNLIANGVLESAYYGTAPWTSNVTQWPATVEMDFPQAQNISDVLIFAGVPWQNEGTLLDYDLQYWNGTSWSEIEHVCEPTKTFLNYTPTVRCTVDSFFSDRWVFEHHFAPVNTAKLRLLVNSVTYGGGATIDVVNAGGQTGPQQIVLREIEVFNSQAGVAPQVLSAPTGGSVSPSVSDTLAPIVSGSGPLSYQWIYDGAPLNGANAASLNLTQFTEANDGVYTLKVSNVTGSATSAPIPLYLSTPFTKWAENYFPPLSIANPVQLASEDSDGDGVPNLLEYFYDTNPLLGMPAGDANATPTFSLDTSGTVPFMVLDYRQNAAATDLSVAVQTTNLGSGSSWQTVQPDVVEPLGLDPITGDPWTRLKVKATGTSNFMRLLITRP